jgi:hypothetical protein
MTVAVADPVSEFGRADQARDPHGRWAAEAGGGEGLAPHQQTRKEYTYRRAQAQYDELARHKERASGPQAAEHYQKLMDAVHPSQFDADHEHEVRKAVENGHRLSSAVARDYPAIAAGYKLPARSLRHEVSVHEDHPGKLVVTVNLPGGRTFRSTPVPHDGGDFEAARDAGLAQLTHQRHAEETRGVKNANARDVAASRAIDDVHPFIVPHGRPLVIAADLNAGVTHQFAIRPAVRDTPLGPTSYLSLHYRNADRPGSPWIDAEGPSGKVFRGPGAYDQAVKHLGLTGRLSARAEVYDPALRQALREGPALARPGPLATAPEHEKFYQEAEKRGASMRGKKETIKVQRAAGGPVPVQATVFGNLALHKPAGRGVKGYVVTHVPTGMAVAFPGKVREGRGLIHLLHSSGVDLSFTDPKKWVHTPDYSRSEEIVRAWRRHRGKP